LREVDDAEERGPEQDARDELAEDRGLAEPLGGLAAELGGDEERDEAPQHVREPGEHEASHPEPPEMRVGLMRDKPRGPSVRVHQWLLGPMQNFTYLVEDGEVGFVVDPAWELPRLQRSIEEQAPGVRVTHVLATHGHFDHVQGVPDAKKRFGAKVVAHESADHPEVDIRVKDGEELRIGAMRVRVVHTPGHRFDSVCYQVDGTHVLTGDTLFVGECGRVDLPGSDPVAMHKSLTQTLRAMPDALVVLPGHDYGKTPTSTLGEQKRTNHTMQPRALDEFLEFMESP